MIFEVQCLGVDPLSGAVRLSRRKLLDANDQVVSSHMKNEVDNKKHEGKSTEGKSSEDVKADDKKTDKSRKVIRKRSDQPEVVAEGAKIDGVETEFSLDGKPCFAVHIPEIHKISSTKLRTIFEIYGEVLDVRIKAKTNGSL
jgi:hypothetical protein